MYRIQRAVQPSRPRTATFAHPLPYASRSRCASPLVVLNVVSADSRTGTRKTYVRFCIKIADYRFPRRLSVRLERRDVSWWWCFIRDNHVRSTSVVGGTRNESRETCEAESEQSRRRHAAAMTYRNLYSEDMCNILEASFR